MQPPSNKPPKPPALGKSLSGSWQSPKAVELFEDDVQIVFKAHDAPSFERPAIGSAHPDTSSYPDHVLSVIVRDEVNALDRLFYVKAKTSLISKRTNEVQQTVTDTTTLVADNAAVPTVSALLSFQDENLANSKAKRVTSVLPSVFSAVEHVKERPDVTPTKFKALIPIIETSTTAAGSAAAPTLVAGDVRASDRQTKVFEHRTSVANRAATSLPTSIISKLTSPKKQVITRTETLEADSTTPAVPTALLDVTFEKLGDGTALETQDAIPAVFDAQAYRKSAPDPAPLKFRIAAPTTTSETISAATSVSSPSLGTGELARSEERIDSFTKKSSVTSRASISLPVSIVSKKTNAKKQVVVVTETLESDATTPAVPTALLDVTFEKLGDGTAVETQEAVASVFDQDTRSIEIPDVAPGWAKALLATTTTSSEAAATSVSDPTLSTGQIRKRVQRSTAFTVQTDITARDTASLPKTRTNKELTTEFGGSVIDEVQTQAVGAQSPSSGGLMVVDSKVETLGDGTSVLSTKTAEDGSWPVLSGIDVDPGTGIKIAVTRQVVAAGTASSGDYEEIKPLDKWRSISIASAISGSLPTSQEWETTMQHSFPNELTAAVFEWAEASNAGNYAFDAALLLDMKNGYSGPVRAKVTRSFSDGPPTDVVAVTTFFPQGHMVGFAWYYASADIVKAQAQTFSIPPALHDEIDLGLGGSATGSSILAATDPIALPASDTLIVKEVNVEPWRFNIFVRHLVEIYVP